jgi:hypothetical protein
MDALIIPLLALHLLCMNLAAAGPLVGCWLEWKAWRNDAAACFAGRYLGVASGWALVLGALLGVAMGWLLWDETYAKLWLSTLRYKATMGLYEFLFSLVLLGIAAILWRNPTAHGGIRITRAVCAFLAGTNLLYHFPFLFAVAVELQTQTPLAETIDSAMFRTYMMKPAVLSRVIHVMLASFAMSGVVLFGAAIRGKKNGLADTDVRRIRQWGAWWALMPSLLQFVVGLWIVASLPGVWQQRVMGGDVWATSFLGISILLSIFMVQDFAALAFGEERPLLTMRSMTYMLIVVLLMSGVLRRMRPAEIPNRMADTAFQSVNITTSASHTSY